MNWRERLRSLDRIQQARAFKIAATIAILAVAAVGYATYAVIVTSEPGFAGIEIPEGATPEQAARIQSNNALMAGFASARDPVAGVGIATAAIAAITIIIVWIGAGLSFLAILSVAGVVAFPLWRYEPTSVYGWLLGSATVLTMSFVALIQALRLAFSGTGPVMSIARNVLAEAVRLKLSLVFVVMLIVLLAALPQVLDEEQALRYRVQAFLQWSTGGSFWIIALMVLFFSVGTVAFEQRDKTVWQTMTKPVSSWQYLLGKWLGLAGFAAVLLAVASSGVFLFTEHLRTQPALGERDGVVDPTNPSEDRIVLETQVLTARRSVIPEPIISWNEPELDEAVNQRIETERRQNPEYDPAPAERRKIRLEIREAVSLEYQSIDPVNEQFEDFYFTGLGAARGSPRPLTLRYKINAEGNRPDQIYRLAFQFPNGMIEPGRRTGLGFSHTMTLSTEAIDDDGAVTMRVWNGRLVQDESGRMAFAPNPATITFPSDGLELSYAAGSYRLNFVRIVFILWIKLGFLAAVGIWTATFLSFPVAGLVTIGTFLTAEGASFISGSLEQFGTTDYEGNTEYWRVVADFIADWVSSLFLVYSELKPTSRLADGRLLSWGEVFRGTSVLVLTTGFLFVSGSMIFKRRELAIYSGN